MPASSSKGHYTVAYAYKMFEMPADLEKYCGGDFSRNGILSEEYMLYLKLEPVKGIFTT